MSGLALPHCPACGAFHYPRREACPFCFAVPEAPMGEAEASPHGAILTTTRLHVTLDPAFAAHLPLAIGSVAMDAGPVVIAYLAEALQRGDAVTLSLEEGPDGTPAFFARPRAPAG